MPINVKKVKKPTNKIAIFYHVGQFGNWERLFQEQINSLVVSGLYHICDFIHIGVNGDETYKANISMKFNFNHPVKALYFFVRLSQADSQNLYSAMSNKSPSVADNFSSSPPGSRTPVGSAKLQLNGNDRFATRQGEYFSLVQPYEHHENTPDMYHKGINVYSFALKPEEHQPSGTLNMSRIDTAVLSLSSKMAGTIYIFAVNYNVLRILSGMGGLAYSN